MAPSVLTVLRAMDDNNARNHPSKTSIELDIKFKMSKQGNNHRSYTPTPSTDDESSSTSLDSKQKGLDPHEEIITRKLARRAYHLPGNSWRQDLSMYIRNNHLIFGLCCHHKVRDANLFIPPLCTYIV